jgi:hypothetical protein
MFSTSVGRVMSPNQTTGIHSPRKGRNSFFDDEKYNDSDVIYSLFAKAVIIGGLTLLFWLLIVFAIVGFVFIIL